MKRILTHVITAMIVLAINATATARINRNGPASGGGLEPYHELAVGDAITSSEFRRLDCGPGETRIGRNSYYTCGGRTFMKDNIGGRLMYVVVPGIPY